MTRVKPGQRKRAFNPKTRTGCLTCKLRRLKCDEGKPNCYKCISTGRQCDGYETTTLQQCPPVLAAQSTSLIKNPSSTLVANSQDGRSFQYFLERTLGDMTRIFPEPLWTVTMPKLSRSEPAIGHAVLALSKFHERFHRRREGLPTPFGDQGGQDALNQYNRAIAKLLEMQPNKAPPADIYLITCVLFIAIELLRGKYGAAVSLGHHGLKMIRDLQHPTRSKSYATHCTAAERAKLLPLLDLFFIGMECQIFTTSWRSPVITYNMRQSGDNPFTRVEKVSNDPQDDVSVRLRRIGLDSEKPIYFDSVEVARSAFARSWYIFISARAWSISADPEKTRRNAISYMEFFGRFDSALDDLLGRRPFHELTPQERYGLYALDMHRVLFRCNSRVLPTSPDLSMQWDKLTHEFIKAVELAELILGVPPPLPDFCSPRADSLYLPLRTASIASVSGASFSETTSRMSISGSSSASSPLYDVSQSPWATLADDTVDSPTSTTWTSQKRATPRASYAPDLNVLPPIFGVIQRCRDPILRRRIIRMLRASGRQEGFYDGLLIAVVAERVLEIEEPSPIIMSAAEIPAAARLEAIYVRLSDNITQGGNGAIVEFRRPVTGGKPLPSPSGLSTMVPDDDPLTGNLFSPEHRTSSVTWLERIRW